MQRDKVRHLKHMESFHLFSLGELNDDTGRIEKVRGAHECISVPGFRVDPLWSFFFFSIHTQNRSTKSTLKESLTQNLVVTLDE